MSRICALALFLCVVSSNLFAADELPLISAGSVAPSFSLPTLTGTREALSAYCGEKLSKPYVNNIHHIVIVSFWATYCKPCQKEIPELMEFAEKHAGDSIKIFCVSIDKEGADIVAPFVKDKGYALPVLLDPYKATAQRYGVSALPSLVIIGPDGIVKFASAGFDEKSRLDIKLETIVKNIRSGTDVNVKMKGETVPVKNDMGPASKIPSAKRFKAVARVECGESVEKVAADVGVEKINILEWQRQLKDAMKVLWEK